MTASDSSATPEFGAPEWHSKCETNYQDIRNSHTSGWTNTQCVTPMRQSSLNSFGRNSSPISDLVRDGVSTKTNEHPFKEVRRATPMYVTPPITIPSQVITHTRAPDSTFVETTSNRMPLGWTTGNSKYATTTTTITRTVLSPRKPTHIVHSYPQFVQTSEGPVDFQRTSIIRESVDPKVIHTRRYVEHSGSLSGVRVDEFGCLPRGIPYLQPQNIAPRLDSASTPNHCVDKNSVSVVPLENHCSFGSDARFSFGSDARFSFGSDARFSFGSDARNSVKDLGTPLPLPSSEVERVSSESLQCDELVCHVPYSDSPRPFTEADLNWRSSNFSRLCVLGTDGLGEELARLVRQEEIFDSDDVEYRPEEIEQAEKITKVDYSYFPCSNSAVMDYRLRLVREFGSNSATVAYNLVDWRKSHKSYGEEILNAVMQGIAYFRGTYATRSLLLVLDSNKIENVDSVSSLLHLLMDIAEHWFLFQVKVVNVVVRGALNDSVRFLLTELIMHYPGRIAGIFGWGAEDCSNTIFDVPISSYSFLSPSSLEIPEGGLLAHLNDFDTLAKVLSPLLRGLRPSNACLKQLPQGNCFVGKERVIFGNKDSYTKSERVVVVKLLKRMETTDLHNSLRRSHICLRFLTALDFSISNTLTAIMDYDKMRCTPLQFDVADKAAGIVYCHGRDKKHRPVLYINFKDIAELPITKLEVISLINFWMRIIEDELLLDGKVEQITVVVDMKDLKIKHFFMSTSYILEHLSKYYPSRLRRAIIVEASSALINMGGFSKLTRHLSQEQAKRIVIHQEAGSEILYKYIRKEQLEEKYGGLCPNLPKHLLYDMPL